MNSEELFLLIKRLLSDDWCPFKIEILARYTYNWGLEMTIERKPVIQLFSEIPQYDDLFLNGNVKSELIFGVKHKETHIYSVRAAVWLDKAKDIKEQYETHLNNSLIALLEMAFMSGVVHLNKISEEMEQLNILNNTQQ